MVLVAVAAVGKLVTEGQELVVGPAVLVVLQGREEAVAASWREAAAGWQ